MGKRKINVDSYERTDGTPVRGHSREIENIKKRQEELQMAKNVEDSLERFQKKIESEKKKDHKELTKKMTDKVDDSEAVLGRLSNSVDDKYVEQFTTKEKLNETKKQIKKLDKSIKKDKKALQKETSKEIKKL